MGSKIGVLKVAAKRVGIPLEEYLEKIDSGFKWCHQGNHWQPRDNFHTDQSRGDGLAAVCKNCRAVENPYASLKGRVSTFKGKKHTAEAKQIMSKKRMGNKYRLGKSHTEQIKKKISEITRQRTARGANHYAFSHGEFQRSLDDRRKIEYADWRNAVFIRDNFTCQHCGDSKGGNLNAHHIKPFADHPELRFSIDNGITLCETCHDIVHYGRPKSQE